MGHFAFAIRRQIAMGVMSDGPLSELAPFLQSDSPRSHSRFVMLKRISSMRCARRCVERIRHCLERAQNGSGPRTVLSLPRQPIALLFQPRSP
jgi:hypothetical protein